MELLYRVVGGFVMAFTTYFMFSFIAMDLGWVFEMPTDHGAVPKILGRFFIIFAFLFGVLDDRPMECIFQLPLSIESFFKMFK